MITGCKWGHSSVERDVWQYVELTFKCGFVNILSLFIQIELGCSAIERSEWKRKLAALDCN